MRYGFVLRWMAIGAIGTVVGLGAAGFVGLMGLAAESMSAAVSAGVVFGAAIGVSIGLAQGLVLSRRNEQISASRWATYTAVGAAVAWAAVAYPIGQLAEVGADPTWTERLLWSVAIGLAAGGIVGFVQWLELRRTVADSWQTIAVQAFAWMVGALILVGADGVIGEDVAELTSIGIAAAALALAGTVVASIQGAALDRMIPASTAKPAKQGISAAG